MKSKINIILIILFAVILLLSCKKEVTLFLPKSEIISAKVTSLTSNEIVYEIDPGNKENIDSARIIFDDITVLSAPDIIKNIPLASNGKIYDTLRINLNRPDHDFSVQIQLASGENSWLSNFKILRSYKCKFKVTLPQFDYTYSDLSNNISSVRNNTDTAVLIIFSILQCLLKSQLM